jgi:hypothetical protein
MMCLRRRIMRRRGWIMMVEKSKPPTVFLSAVEGISNARKYLMKLHVETKMMAALSSIENDYTLFSTKVKRKKLCLLDSDLDLTF